MRVRGVHSHEVAPNSITAKHLTAPLALVVILEQVCREMVCSGLTASVLFSSVYFISPRANWVAVHRIPQSKT